MTVKIHKASIDDLENYVDHLFRHLNEKDAHHFAVSAYCDENAKSRNDRKERILKRWSADPGSETWEISWVLRDQDQIVGHIDISSLGTPASKHRVDLSMGIELDYRGKSWGSKLMAQALSWVKKQEWIEWVDLGVFAENQRAQTLYRKFNFKETGRIPDRFRINKIKVDDIQMTLSKHDLLSIHL